MLRSTRSSRSCSVWSACPSQVHPLGLRHTESAGGRHRHHQRGGTLIDRVAGDQEPRIRVADHPVLVGDGFDLLHGTLDRRGRKWVLGSHFGEGREELGHLVSVVLDAEAEAGAPRVVEQTVLDRRTGQAVLGGVLAHVLLEAVAAVLELPADGFGEVGLVVALREVLRASSRSPSRESTPPRCHPPRSRRRTPSRPSASRCRRWARAPRARDRRRRASPPTGRSCRTRRAEAC